MRNIIIIMLFFFSINLLGQKKINGILSANEFTGKIISEYDGEYFWVIHNSKYTVIDNKGSIILKDIGMKNTFQPGNNIARIKKGVFVDYNNKKLRTRFISLQNKKALSDYVYSDVIPYNNGTYLAIRDVNKKKEYLYLDENLKTIYKVNPNLIAKKYKLSRSQQMSYNTSKPTQFFGAFNNGLVKFYNPKTRKFGFKNAKGMLIVPAKYKKVGDFSENVAFFQTEEKLFGFLDAQGKIVIPETYSKQPYSFLSGRAKVVSKDGFFGFVDTKNELVIDAKYRFATNFYKNRALVKEKRLSPVLLINERGTVLQEFDKNFKIKFQEQANAFMKPGLKVEYLTHINSTLKQLVDFKKGIFFKRINAYGLVDIEGNVILDFKYSSLKDYNKGLMLAIFKDKNKVEKQGLINEKGIFVVEVGLSKF